MSVSDPSAAAVIPPAVCPVCDYRMDRATDVAGGDATPSPGDYSICINCASLLVFDEKLQFAHPTHEQLQEAPPLLWEAQRQVKTVAKVTPRYERLPCGCVAGSEETDGKRTFVFIPHALDCEWLAHVQTEMERSGKPVTVIDAR